MNALPKPGTLEALVLEAMIAKPEGVTYLDFADIGMTDEQLAQIVSNLRHGMYESEADADLKIDA